MAAPPRLTRRMPLPSTPYDPDNPSSTPEVDLAPGGPPAALYPDGTVFVAQPAGGKSSPLVVTEWDLATGKALQHATLPLQPGVTMALTQGGFIVVALSPGPPGSPGTFVQLGDSMQVLAKTPSRRWAGTCRPSVRTRR